MKLKLILIMTLWNANMKCNGAKILAVLPTPSYSHQVFFQPVLLELVKRGHEVTVITPSPMIYQIGETFLNLTIIGVQVPAPEWDENLGFCLRNKCDMHAQVMSALNIIAKIFEAQMKTDGVQNLISDKNTKFDLIFYENLVNAAIGFSYLYNAPAIEISCGGGSSFTFDVLGAISHRLFYPPPIRQRVYNLTIWEKILELYMELSIEYSYKTQLEQLENKRLKTFFGPDVPDLNELRKNIQMMFLNVHPVWDFNRPVPPNIIYLGGLTQDYHNYINSQNLPEDLKSYLDSSKNGVIYISFGTSVEPSQFTKENLNALTKAIADLPYDVLMKWSDDELPGQPRNVKISKWLPQIKILNHPKTKLFIMQGGIHSIKEAVEAGMPVVVIPQFGDQYFNAELCVIHGIGLRLDMDTITETKFKTAIETVIGNKSYRENIGKLRNIIKDQPQSSLERAVWWTEYVLRHGGATHLRAAAAQVSWTQYYMLDIVLLLLILLITVFVIVTLLLRLLFVKCKTTSNKFTERKRK